MDQVASVDETCGGAGGVELTPGRGAPLSAAAAARLGRGVTAGRAFRMHPVTAGRSAGGAMVATVLNLFGSHSPPLAANMRNGRQNTPPLAAGIVYSATR
jgi:hypothetical protein